MLEEYLIRYCAPTLGNLKAGSLFAYPCTVPEQLLSHVSPLNSLLNAMDIFVEPLKYGKTSSLIYVYRKRLLDAYLSRNKVSTFLRSFEYPGGCVIDYIVTLKKRLNLSECFPHEIGIFLGYPVEDVSAFIHNKGENCLLTGFWKVYHNVDDAARDFFLYNTCIKLYSTLYRHGYPLQQIIATPFIQLLVPNNNN